MEGLKLKYFVLSPTKDDPYGEASRSTMLVYADEIKSFNMELANDLRSWVSACWHHINEAKILKIAGKK
jgi:hypothetical protein